MSWVGSYFYSHKLPLDDYCINQPLQDPLRLCLGWRFEIIRDDLRYISLHCTPLSYYKKEKKKSSFGLV